MTCHKPYVTKRSRYRVGQLKWHLKLKIDRLALSVPSEHLSKEYAILITGLLFLTVLFHFAFHCERASNLSKFLITPKQIWIETHRRMKLTSRENPPRDPIAIEINISIFFLSSSISFSFSNAVQTVNLMKFQHFIVNCYFFKNFNQCKQNKIW